ncbi:hypothetical protein [Vibrio sp. HI00D65]|uniref:hypothetical protein n=1 Tax=Vibrio sp. HI00D65 TaxID=1822216 RepID=UPI0009EDC8FC|nr:hypothetical protein [Vibrio sp. HI00D65]
MTKRYIPYATLILVLCTVLVSLGVNFQIAGSLFGKIKITELEPFNTMLISVIRVNGSLHYVLNDDQGNWFDSGITGTSAEWDSIENWHSTANKREGAAWLGISIRVKLLSTQQTT